MKTSKKSISYKKYAFVAFSLLVLSLDLYARVGGAGGGSENQSSDGGSGDASFVWLLVSTVFRILFYSFTLYLDGHPTLAIVYFLVTTPLFIWGAWKFYGFYQRFARGKDSLSQNINRTINSAIDDKVRTTINPMLSGVRSAQNAPGHETFIAKNPNFDFNQFLGKAKQAFTETQIAWSKKDTSSIRRYISDGFYQKYKTQILMMNLLKQTNKISDIKIYDAHIASFTTDGPYDIIEVAIEAVMDDQFVSETMPHLNSPGGREVFTEYWSFIRKQGIQKEKDIFSSTNCPSCAGILPDELTDAVKCPYCGTIVNSGEYDWVLAEITQGDARFESVMTNLLTQIFQGIRTSLGTQLGKDFAIQNLEDKVSNAFMQIMRGLVSSDLSFLNRFAKKELIEGKIKNFSLAKPFQGKPWAFNRIYTEAVSVVNYEEQGSEVVVYTSVKFSYQRAQILNDQNAKLVDPSIKSDEVFLEVRRVKDLPPSKGSVYANSCGACGAPYNDSAIDACPYCQTPLASTQADWIVTDIYTREEFSLIRQKFN